MITTPALEKSTASAAWAALVIVNFTVSRSVSPEYASPMMSPCTLKVEEVSPRPPSTVSLLYSELSNPVLRTAKADTEATTTKEMSTIAVSRSVEFSLVAIRSQPTVLQVRVEFPHG